MMLGLDPVQTPRGNGCSVAWGQLGDIPSVQCSIPVSLDGESGVAPGTLDVAAGGPGCSAGSWDEGAAHGGVWRGTFAAGWPRGQIRPPPSHIVSACSMWPHQCRGRPPQPRCADGLVQDVGLPERDAVRAHMAARGDKATEATSHSDGDPPEDKSPRAPASLRAPPFILPSLCPPRYWLPPLPCWQPDPSPGHQNPPTAVPGGGGPTCRSPRPEQRQRSGECHGGDTGLVAPTTRAGMLAAPQFCSPLPRVPQVPLVPGTPSPRGSHAGR